MTDSPPGVSAEELVRARATCEELFLDFHRHIDHGAATRSLELFTDDGVFEARGQRYEGRQALTGFLQAREAATGRHTRHLASNFRFVLETPTRARAVANLTLFTASGDDASVLELEAVVDCVVMFTCLPSGEWRISSRRHVRFATAA